MDRVTSGWTEQHSAVALLLTAACAATAAGVLDGGWVAGAVATATVATCLVALLLDAWGGAVVGLVAVGALVAVRRGSSAWVREDFAAATMEALAILLTGALAGATASRLRRQDGVHARPSPWQPAHGSLGLLGADAAMARLEEECARSARLGRPLTLAVLDVVVTAPDLSPASVEAAQRTVARLVESRTRENDVPFALSAGRFGIVFPESGPDVAWDAVGEIVQAAGSATFTQGSRRTARPVDEVTSLHAGIAQYAVGRDTWQTLLEDATGALAKTRAEAPRDQGEALT